MTRTIDLNADLGEGGDHDEELMTVITSCNIACGGHAGNTDSMRLALTRAKAFDVAVGAHPSFPDRKNFGRSESALSGSALEDELFEQIAHLSRLASEMDIPISHIKPHGALYNMAATSADLSSSILNVQQNSLLSAMIYGPPGSQLERICHARDISFVAEGFADRTYEADGRLRNRKEPGAVIEDHTAQSQQAIQLALEQTVTSFDNQIIPHCVRTICVHGDTPGAYKAAKAIKSALISSGVTICRPA